MKSALYVGNVRHRRFAPLDHAFHYRVGLCYLNLAELDTVFRGRWLWSTKRPAWAWMRRADYLGPRELSLDEAVRRRVEEQTGRRPAGSIRMLTHLRTFGYAFNPVSFYFCFDAGERLETVVAEITNTPWNERHAYVLSRDEAIEASGDRLRFRFPKTFHVSPFFDMDHEYDWRFHLSERAASVHMENWVSGVRVFDATMSLERREITGPALAGVLIRYPLMSLKVSAAIYWQAFRLWRKRCPFFVHPSKRPQEDLQTVGPVSKGA